MPEVGLNFPVSGAHGMSRRSFLQFMGAAAVGANVLPSGQRVEAQGLVPEIHTNPSPLSGIFRPPPSRATGYSLTDLSHFNTSYYRNAFGFYNYGFYPNPFYYSNSLYLNNGRVSFFNNFQSSSRQNTRAIQQQNCCCRPTQDGGIEETKFHYPVALTREQIIAHEKLYEDTVKSLVRIGYTPAKNSQGEEINRPQDLLYYLTPIVFAHDVYKPETLSAIEAGLENGNPKLTETYGSLKFFQEASTVIKFHKTKKATLDKLETELLVTGKNVLVRDRDSIIKELKATQESVRKEEQAQSVQRRTIDQHGNLGSPTEFTIGPDQTRAMAEFIVYAYHHMSVNELKEIRDTIKKAMSTDESVRRTITLEQRLNIEPLMMLDTPKVQGQSRHPDIIDPETFISYIETVNDLHSDDKQGLEKREAIQGLITETAASINNR